MTFIEVLRSIDEEISSLRDLLERSHEPETRKFLTDSRKALSHMKEILIKQAKQKQEEIA